MQQALLRHHPDITCSWSTIRLTDGGGKVSDLTFKSGRGADITHVIEQHPGRGKNKFNWTCQSPVAEDRKTERSVKSVSKRTPHVQSATHCPPGFDEHQHPLFPFSNAAHQVHDSAMASLSSHTGRRWHGARWRASCRHRGR